ncbi:MAG: lipid-A-disaccharide synthase [Micavibrio sp.]
MSRHICVIAGEPSGDFLGGRLIAALKEAAPDTVFSGVGGHYMAEQGVQSLFSYQQLAVMGIAEILPKLPTLLARIRQTIDHIKKTKPAIIVTIDSPDFSFRVLRAVRKEMGDDAPKLVHYVAPSVWAWRAARAEKIARFLDGVICLFDFEPPYFEEHGLKAVAAGHPLVEGGAMNADGAVFRDICGIGGSETIIGLLFGSRKGELKRTAPVLRDAAFLLAEKQGRLPHIVAPTLPHLYNDVMNLIRDYPGPIHITTDAAQKWNGFKAMDVAFAVSGTVGLELAAMQVPHVIGYRTNWMTAALIRRVIKIDYAHLANIMMGAPVVPEFLQEKCDAASMAVCADALLKNPEAQKQALAQVAHKIGFGQEKTPSQKAAAFVLSL